MKKGREVIQPKVMLYELGKCVDLIVEEIANLEKETGKVSFKKTYSELIHIGFTDYGNKKSLPVCFNVFSSKAFQISFPRRQKAFGMSLPLWFFPHTEQICFITVPQIVFDMERIPYLDEIRCYIRYPEVREIVERNIDTFISYFNVREGYLSLGCPDDGH